MDKINVIVIVMLIVAVTFIGTIIYGVKSTNNFCESKGYNWWHTNVEEGYIACCNSIVKDHIKTDETICKAFEYDVWFN